MKKKIDLANIALATCASLFLALPLFALFYEVPWKSALNRIVSPEAAHAIWLSLWTSSIAALVCVVLGVPLAWTLARGNPRITNVLRPLVLAPIVLPPTVAGMALLALLGRNGILGKFLYDLTGFSIPFTSWAVVITGVFVGMPFLALVVESTFRHLPSDIEDAAQIDRVSPRGIFSWIALPQARNGIATGLILAWARVIGEFGATMMFAGSLPSVTQTWTMQVYFSADTDRGTAYTLSALMTLVAVGVVFSLRNQLRQAFAN